MAPFESLDFATVDHHRALRQGYPEVVYGEGKNAQQILAITERILEHGRVPEADPFRFTAEGVPWIDHEWLFQVLVRAMELVGGLSLIFWAKVAALGGLAYWLFRDALRAGLVPGLAATRFFGRHDVHVSLGVETNTDDLDRSRVRYAAGATLRLFDPLTFIVDVLGSSAFTSASFTEQGVSGSVDRTDLVDVYGGFKVEITPKFLAHAGVIVPVNDDGLRADVVPTVGLIVDF